jgi:hypothetical protein
MELLLGCSGFEGLRNNISIVEIIVVINDNIRERSNHRRSPLAAIGK